VQRETITKIDILYVFDVTQSRPGKSMRAAKFVPILTLVLSSVALQGACDVDSSEGELDYMIRAAELCSSSTDSNSTTRPLACELEIPVPPEGDTFDPTKVNITIEFDGVFMNLPFVENESECNGNDGWYYSPNKLEPTSIVLCPSTCAWVQKTEKANIEVVLGCDTIASEPLSVE
jgi:hypothetical protein